MEEKATLIEALVEKAEVYTKSSIDLLKLIAINKYANLMSSFVSTLIISIAVLCVTMMVNIGAALWIGKFFSSSIGGFFIVAAFYTIVAIICSIFKKSLIKAPLANFIINQIRKNNTEKV